MRNLSDRDYELLKLGVRIEREPVPPTEAQVLVEKFRAIRRECDRGSHAGIFGSRIFPFNVGEYEGSFIKHIDDVVMIWLTIGEETLTIRTNGDDPSIAQFVRKPSPEAMMKLRLVM
jgi:hypothetical protein